MKLSIMGLQIGINYVRLTSVYRNENRLLVQFYGRRQVLGMTLSIQTFGLLMSVSRVFDWYGKSKMLVGE